MQVNCVDVTMMNDHFCTLHMFWLCYMVTDVSRYAGRDLGTIYLKKLSIIRLPNFGTRRNNTK